MPNDSNPLFKNKGNNKAPGLGDVFRSFGDFFKNLIDLRAGLDREGTIVNIKNNKKMAGANVWLLMCSIMIASLGLDLNSPAVIIGAMLISPLMSPILGIGLAVGVNDNDALFLAFKHFGIAIAIALVTSTVYFWLTPFGNETSEIRARTAPTLLDVMVAFFGGVAGIISGSRKDKSNAIPGVAIATALMPPLCVTGYGLAKGNWVFMLNSFYLFFLNATFVALATYLIVRLLQFPLRKYADPKEARKTRLILGFIALLMIIPSGNILIGVLQKANQQKIIGDFLRGNFPDAFYKIEPVVGTDSTNVKLIAGAYIPLEQIDSFKIALESKGAKKFNLNFLQDNESRAELEKLKSNSNEYFKGKKDNKSQDREENKIIEHLINTLDSLNSDTLLMRQFTEEVKVLFPELASYRFSKNAAIVDLENDTTTSSDTSLLLVDWKKGNRLTNRQKNNLSEKLAAFVRIRMELKEVEVEEVPD